MSYALLGDIAFELLYAPHNLSENHQANFAQHEVLSGKPKLQAMGLGLVEIHLDLRLHHSLGNVEQRYQQLLSAKQQMKPLAWVLGNGQFQGHFVITEISSKTLMTDEQGLALARELSLRLKEFVGEVSENFIGEAVQIGSNMPLSSLVAMRNPVQFMDKQRGFLNKAVQMYQRARQIIDVVRNGVQMVRNFAHDPMSALAMLPNLALQMSNVVGGLREVLQDFPMLNNSNLWGSRVQVLSEFMAGLGTMATAFEQFLTITHATTASTLNQWINVSRESIERADKIAK